MASIEPTSRIIPTEESTKLAPAVQRTVIIIHGGVGLHGDRRACLPAQSRRQSPRRSGKHRADHSSLLDLLERVLTSWPITLRLGLLLLILLTGTAAVAATAGLISQLMLAALNHYVKRKEQ